MEKILRRWAQSFLLVLFLFMPPVMVSECCGTDQDETNRQLTLKDVQQIVERAEQGDGAVDLNALKNLDATTARIVANSRGKLFLNGLKAITPDVAEILARHRGWLHLDGLLNGIRVLERDVALALLPYPGQLYLDGVETITEDVAEIIASRRSGVELYGVRNINYQSVAMLRKNSEIILPAKFNRADWWPF